MYAFLLAAAPLTLLALNAWFFTAEERKSSPAFIFKGLASSFPAVLLWLAISLQIRPDWGSASIIPLFWLQYWLLPSLFMLIAWVISNGITSLGNLTARPFLSFALPYTAVFLAASLIINWQLPFAPPFLALPLLWISSVLVLAACLDVSKWYGPPNGVAWLLLYPTSSFLAAWSYALFFMRQAVLASILTGLVCLAGTVYAIYVLHKRFR